MEETSESGLSADDGFDNDTNEDESVSRRDRYSSNYRRRADP